MSPHSMSPTARGVAPPMSVEQITHRAQEYDYDPQIRLRYWLRTAQTLIKEANIYEREGNDEQAYLLLFRHAQLVLVHLVKHPDARDESHRQALAEAEAQVNLDLSTLEHLRPRIKKRYERYTQLMREREARRTVATPHQRQESVVSPRRGPADPALAGVAEPLEAGENRELAVRLAQKEFSRRATARKATRQAGISQDEERIRRTGGVWGDWEEAYSRDDGDARDDLSNRIQQVRLRMDRPEPPNRTDSRKAVEQKPLEASKSNSYRYPTVPRHSSFAPSPPALLPPDTVSHKLSGLESLSGPPQRPPKEYEIPRPPSVDRPPPIPGKVTQPTEEASPAPSDGTPPSSDLHPSTFTFKPSAYLENGNPLRTVFLPPDLRTKFLEIAAPNTRRNLETCGILCGTLISNALFISKLLIPEQESTSDTCETVNESAIFDFCDSEDLMVLGWIHTHPSQTCFMSSRDLHTHSGYQVMLPESIAIVCAPSKSPDWGVFRLTDPPGLKSVLNCTQSGLFHPHAETDIYTEALRPGHVFEAKGLEFESVDFRP